MQIRFAPLVRWPTTPTKNRQRSRFDSTYSQTLDLLNRELQQIGARNVVIQLDCSEREIRRDGLPRSDARMNGPGVVISFEAKTGSVSMPCDTFPDWQDNLRAIAMSLEALRKIDRYGVTKNGEQYRGWAALPAPNQTRDAAIAKVYQLADVPRSAPFDTARKNALTNCHPDRNGGDKTSWNELREALGIIGQ